MVNKEGMNISGVLWSWYVVVFYFLAQERWWSLVQLNTSPHPVLREARSAHSSWIQYPWLRTVGVLSFHILGHLNNVQGFSSVCHFYRRHVLLAHSSNQLISLRPSLQKSLTQRFCSGRTARRTSSLTSLLGTEFTCLVYTYVSSSESSLKASSFAFKLIRSFVVWLIYRCTTRWIKSPLRKLTAWLGDLTVLSLGLCIAVVLPESWHVYLFRSCASVSLVVAWSWIWTTFWRHCGNTWLSFAFIPRKEEVHTHTHTLVSVTQILEAVFISCCFFL